MSRNLYVIRKGSLFVILFLMFYFLPLQSATATLIEYSISSNVAFWSEGDIWTPSEITGTAVIDDERYNLGNPECITGYNTLCHPITYSYLFNMSVGDQYSFTGIGSITYSYGDVYGRLNGIGDWTEIYHSNLCSGRWGPCADFQNYEEWLAFELPTEIRWEAGYQCCNGEVIVSNPLLNDNRHHFGVTLERVSPISVSEPSMIMLMTTGLIGLIGLSRRKKA